MKSIDKIREKHKDVLENKAIDNLIRLKRRGDAETLEYNPAGYPVMSEEAYSEKVKATLPYFLQN
jgi:hypothetical protein